jgi:hypothetical protein
MLRLQSLVAISNSSDPTYDNPPAATWSSIETTVGIICASLPALRPLVVRIFPRLLTVTSSSQDRYQRSGGPSQRLRSRSTANNQSRGAYSSKHEDFDNLGKEVGSSDNDEAFMLETSPTTAYATRTIVGPAGNGSDTWTANSDEAKFGKEIAVHTVIEQTSEPKR